MNFDQSSILSPIEMSLIMALQSPNGVGSNLIFSMGSANSLTEVTEFHKSAKRFSASSFSSFDKDFNIGPILATISSRIVMPKLLARLSLKVE